MGLLPCKGVGQPVLPALVGSGACGAGEARFSESGVLHASDKSGSHARGSGGRPGCDGSGGGSISSKAGSDLKHAGCDRSGGGSISSKGAGGCDLEHAGPALMLLGCLAVQHLRALPTSGA
eukprot:scaffold194036_cov15-Tisochrysis_lutea.AAC.1